MGDIDGDTLDWLNGLKLGEKLQYISDFQNGYYMGLIFDRLNLAKGRKFKNTKDMACKFQNYKNIRDLLLENFNVEFPIQNILYNTAELLTTIKECIVKYNRDRKEATLKRIETFSASKIQPQEEKLFASRQRDILSTSKFNQTSKFPKKIQEIEQKLQKYKEIKTKHELLALQDRKRQLEDNRRVIEQHRLFEINKVRTNHEFVKEHERKVYDVWMKTEQIKQTRIQKDNNLKSFLDEKKNKFYQSLREEEVKSFKDGIQAFNLNCIRQGIELEHDPDKPLRKTEENFNKQVVMERIKDNIKIHEKQRKDRIKRENKKAVDAKEANIKAEAIWNQNNLVQKYAKKISKQLDVCSKIRMTINREQAEKAIIAEKMRNRVFAELPQSKIDNEQRNEQYRQRKIQYLDQQVVRLERRQKKHKIIAENALQALIHIVISHEQAYKVNNGFTYQQWKAMERDFLSFEKKDKRIKDQSKFVDTSYEKKAKEYINNKGSWEIHQDGSKLKLSQVVEEIISIGYPANQLPQKRNIPLYMPLKIGFVGDSLSGKTTISQKISQKYGVVFINPVILINQAFQLNKEPVVEDPKKKKDSKKPEQENPQKIALKEWGEKLMKRLQHPSSATIQHYIEAIQFKINYNFQNKVGEEILKEFEEAKVQQTQRYNKAIKQFEQIQKKGKKDPKKGAQESDEPPAEKKYFYTKGFVIDGIDLTLQNLKEIEKRMNGFLSFEQRINLKGEEIKEIISNIIEVPKIKKDSKLTPGTFDLLIELEVKKEILESRQTGEKIIVQKDVAPKDNKINPGANELLVENEVKDRRKTGDRNRLTQKEMATIENYYSDFGNELTKEKAFRKVVNEQTVEETCAEISQQIEKHLDAKYGEIIALKDKKQDESNVESGQALSPIRSVLSKLNKGASEVLVNKLTQIYEKYSKKISQSFSDFDNLRDDFSRLYLSTQQTFVNIINRPDDKAGKILNFQENYNKLQSEKTNIVKDVEASKHLISKLDELYDGLWTSLQSKKNEAVAERQKLLNSNMLNHQIEKIIQVSKVLLQNELNLLIEVIFFIYNTNNAVQGNTQEISPEYLVLGVPPSLQPIFSFEKKDFVSDRLDYFTKQLNQCLSDLPGWLLKKEKKYKINKLQIFQQILTEFINERKCKILLKLQKIRERVKEYYLQYYCFFNILVNKMDDWIIQGIKYQNEFVYDIYKSIKKSIQQAKKSAIKDLFVKDITDMLHPLSSFPANRLPIVTATKYNKIKVMSYAIFMQEIKCISTNGRIHFRVFQSYIDKRRKSQLLEKELLAIQLDIMQQYLVTDDYCNYKEVALAILLWKVKILEQDAINEYESRLTGKYSMEMQSYELLKDDIGLDQFTIIPGITEDKEEQRILKIFIFEIFRQQFRDTINIKDLIDTLRLFSQLQVYKYGDTIMMHEVSHKKLQSSKERSI